MKEQSKIIVALLAGAAAGAMLGILLAPSTGKESREKLSGLAKDILDSAKDLADQISSTSKESPDEDPETTLGV
jgi:gas vesicle protein